MLAALACCASSADEGKKAASAPHRLTFATGDSLLRQFERQSQAQWVNVHAVKATERRLRLERAQPATAGLYGGLGHAGAAHPRFRGKGTAAKEPAGPMAHLLGAANNAGAVATTAAAQGAALTAASRAASAVRVARAWWRQRAARVSAKSEGCAPWGGSGCVFLVAGW